MKHFDNYCAQGDVYFQKTEEAIPVGAEPVAPESGKIIVAHSETGHHHVMDADNATLYRLPGSIMDCLLVVEQPTALEHVRGHDQHESIMFKPGTYRMRRQREYTPEGFRRVQD